MGRTVPFYPQELVWITSCRVQLVLLCHQVIQFFVSCGLSISFALTSRSSFTPASVFDSKHGSSHNSGCSDRRCDKGSGKFTAIRFAGISSQLSRSRLIFIYLLINCVPQTRVIKQMLQPACSSLLWVLTSSKLYSLSENAALAQVMSQIP